MGAGARIEKAILDISGSKMSAVIKDKIDRGVNETRKKAKYVAGRTRSQAEELVDRIKLMIYNSIATLLTFALIVALSLFFYGTFYYAFMPFQVHEHPVNLQFEPCVDNPGLCSKPSATLDLNKKIKLMTGQPYSISLRLEVPESVVNQELGMFMSCMNIQLQDKTLENSCQSSILQFRSPFLIYLETLTFSPFLVSGTSMQKQYLHINLFPRFYDDPHNPAAKAFIEIQSKFLQIYRSTVLIHAEFSGLRHILYHHPWLSTFVGVAANFILLSTIILISWSRLFTNDSLTEETEEKSGLLGDILDYETDLSADEDDVFNNKGAGYVDADQHDRDRNTSCSDYGDQPNQPPGAGFRDQPNQPPGADAADLTVDIDNRINNLVENIE